MVSRLRLCRAIQSARASASATVIIASTSTASCSPKIKVDVIGSKPSGSPKGLGRSPTIAFPRGGKNVHAKRRLFQSICAIHLVPLSMSVQMTVEGKNWYKRNDEARGWHLIRAKG